MSPDEATDAAIENVRRKTLNAAPRGARLSLLLVEHIYSALQSAKGTLTLSFCVCACVGVLALLGAWFAELFKSSDGNIVSPYLYLVAAVNAGFCYIFRSGVKKLGLYAFILGSVFGVGQLGYFVYALMGETLGSEVFWFIAFLMSLVFFKMLLMLTAATWQMEFGNSGKGAL